ncbi:Uncharacterized protein Rs2_09765 [Raphanus sativus]|nr:Uncharacterized protein Rs2_09765 [Raphanus sativus]
MSSRKKKRLKALAASSKSRKFGKAQISFQNASRNLPRLSGDLVADEVVADVELVVSGVEDSLSGSPPQSQVSPPLVGDSIADVEVASKEVKGDGFRRDSGDASAGSQSSPFPVATATKESVSLSTVVPAEDNSGSLVIGLVPVRNDTLPAPVDKEAVQRVPEQPRSYASLLKTSSQLKEVGTPSEHVSGAPFVMIPDEDIAAAKEEFKDFIFAQFQGDSPQMGRIIGIVNAFWARTGPRIYVHKLNNGAFLLKVSNTKAREAILSKSCWNIAGYPMFVSLWSPDFTPQETPITSVVVQVEMRGVPYLMFNRESLSRLATAVGKPVSLAPETMRKENFQVAKLMVQVDLTKKLPDKIISGFSNGREMEIAVAYPWLPVKCASCGKYGHNAEKCRMVPHMEEQERSLPVKTRKRQSRRRSKSRTGGSLEDNTSNPLEELCTKEDKKETESSQSTSLANIPLELSSSNQEEVGVDKRSNSRSRSVRRSRSRARARALTSPLEGRVSSFEVSEFAQRFVKQKGPLLVGRDSGVEASGCAVG